MSKLIYLAAPYSDATPEVMEQRFFAINEAVACIIKAEAIVVYSPVSHWHPIALQCELPRGWEFWSRLDLEMINRCDELWVLKLDGWEESVGVTAEVKYARECGMPVCYVDPEFLVIWEWSDAKLRLCVR